MEISRNVATSLLNVAPLSSRRLTRSANKEDASLRLFSPGGQGRVDEEKDAAETENTMGRKREQVDQRPLKLRRLISDLRTDALQRSTTSYDDDDDDKTFLYRRKMRSSSKYRTNEESCQGKEESGTSSLLRLHEITESDEKSKPKENGRRYSSRQRRRPQIMRVDSFDQQHFGERNDQKEEGSTEEEEEESGEDEEEEEEESNEEESAVDEDGPRRYPKRRNRFRGSVNINRLLVEASTRTEEETDHHPRIKTADSKDNSNHEGGRYSLRRNRAKRVPFNVAPPKSNPSKAASKSRLSRWMEREERETQERRRHRKRRSSHGRERRSHRRRRHYDSSSESGSGSDSSGCEGPAATPRYFGRRSRGRGGGGGTEETDFREYQSRREEEDIDRIRPINGTAMSSSSSSKQRRTGPSRRDLARADAQPVDIDRSIDWSHVGGLSHHVKTLKEMVVLPLLYPEVFERFKMQPPRGVIFHGPPGTGKTLVARALANSCSVGSKRVAFFMRKGADVVSKWVGEAEKQLRLLFEQAKRHQPSIIFFDEIDGLAPVRSSKQDQVHASIVATLLALMDGLDARGQVVVIAATNRIDAIDPALRRPGRFDRELRFALPNRAAREKIFEIHTRGWNPTPTEAFRSAVARSTVGFCGADIKQLCVEAALAALRRCYPQVYTSEHKLLLDPKLVTPIYRDFVEAMSRVVPAARRMEADVGTQPQPIVDAHEPLLAGAFARAFAIASPLYESLSKRAAAVHASSTPGTADKEEGAEDWYELPPASESNAVYAQGSPIADLARAARRAENSTGPCRLLICGAPGSGQKEIMSALLHRFVGSAELPVVSFALPSLLSSASKSGCASIEETCMSRLNSAQRDAPCVVVFPRIELLWDASTHTLRVAVAQWIQELPRSCPLLVLATCEKPLKDLDPSIKSLFRTRTIPVVRGGGGVVAGGARAHVDMESPSDQMRVDFFRAVLAECVGRLPKVRSGDVAATPPRPRRRRPQLERAPVTPQAQENAHADSPRVLHERDEHHLRELRVFMRECLHELSKNRRFASFLKMVDKEEVPDYYEVIKEPMCIDSMFEKVDLRDYVTLGHFMADLKLIGDNVRAYNPCNRSDPTGRRLLRNAVAMVDAAESMAYNFKRSIGYDLFKMCDDVASRGSGFRGRRLIPSLYKATPLPRRIMPATRAAWVGDEVEDRCNHCLKRDRSDEILLCDTPGCTREYHMFCLIPPLKEVPEGKWFCPQCRSNAFSSDSERNGIEFVGVDVVRYFRGDKPTRGVVTGYFHPDQGTADSPLWHVRHSDGDEEDLERHELEAAMLAQGKYVGMRVRRIFDGKPVDGIVTSYAHPKRGSGDCPLWHVRHDDDDEEDLERSEVNEAVELYRAKGRVVNTKNAPSSLPAPGHVCQDTADESKRKDDEGTAESAPQVEVAHALVRSEDARKESAESVVAQNEMNVAKTESTSALGKVDTEFYEDVLNAYVEKTKWYSFQRLVDLASSMDAASRFESSSSEGTARQAFLGRLRGILRALR
eukprot:g1516.t1